MIFHRKQRVLPETAISLQINNFVIQVSHSVKFLGIILVENLSWNVQISSVSRRLSKYVPIMYRIRDTCNVQVLKLVYNCLVYPNLIYANSVWGFCTKLALNPLNIMHKKIIRSMCGLSFTDHTAGFL